MNDTFKNLLRYSLKEFYASSDKNHEKVLGKITNDLIDIAHENGFVDEVAQILEEFN